MESEKGAIVAKNESDIIESIKASVVTTEHDQNERTEQISYGSKTLRLYITLEKGELYATSFVENTAGQEMNNKENETTILYKAAKELIQAEANRRAMQVHYNLKSRNVNMLLWAFDKGSNIFAWDSLPKNIDADSLRSLQKEKTISLSHNHFFTKKFEPQTNG